jgi:uncharacterized protein with PQ loop repeat
MHAARATDLSGVSLPMYALIVVTSVLWSLYGLLIGEPLVIITNIAILPCALFVALKARRAQYPAVPLATEVG